MTVDDRSLAEFKKDGLLGRGPRDVEVERREQQGNVTLVMSHDGYHSQFRLIHHRTLAPRCRWPCAEGRGHSRRSWR